MTDWFFESLRRALVCAVLVLIGWSVDVLAVRVASIVALILFLFFLMRNPDGWARRLSYACTMLGAGTLMPLGTAIKGSGWLEAGGRFEDAAWLGGLAIQIEEGSPWPGLALVAAGVAFGLIQVWREHRAGSAGEPAPSAPRFHASHIDHGQQLALTLPVKNQQPHDITIDALKLEPYRLLDRLLIKEPTVVSALALEGKAPPERVELPVTIGSSEWKYLEVQTTFTARLAHPHTLLKPFWWLLGLHRRYLTLCLRNQNETLQTRALTVLI